MMIHPRAKRQAGQRWLCLGLFVSAPMWLAAPANAVDDPVAPLAVLDSLKPGGEAFDDAVELNATSLDGSVARSSLDTASLEFGTPMRYYVFKTSSKSSEKLTSGDFSKKRGVRWIAVEYKAGEPVSVIEVDNDGNFVQLDGWMPDDVEALDSLGEGSQVLGAGGYGDEVYLLSADRTSVSPLDAAARELTRGQTMSAKDFRKVKLKQEQAALAAEPQGLPADAVGGMNVPAYGASTESASKGTNWLSVSIGVVGLLLFGSAAYLWGRGSERLGQGRRRPS